MANIIFLTVVLSWSAMFSCLFHKRIEECVALAMSVIIILVYASGLVTTFLPGLYLIYIITGCIIIYGIYTLFTKRNFAVFHNWLTPGLIAFLIFAIIFWWANRGKKFTGWDEFSHWGLVIKNMLLFDDFGNISGATTAFRGYPPASSLLAYIYSKIEPQGFEGYALRTMSLYMVSFLIPFFSKNTFKTISKNIFVFFICFLIPIALHKSAYEEIYVDILLGLQFGYILVTFIRDDDGLFKNLNLFTAIMALSLTKAAGVGLSWIIVLIMILTTFSNTSRRKADIKTIFTGISATLLGNYSWKFYLKVTGTSEAWNTSGINWDNIRLLFSPENPEYRKDTIQAFLSFIEYGTIGGSNIKLTYLVLSIIFSLVFLISMTKLPEEKVRHAIQVIKGAFLGLVIYTFSLLFLYLFTYSEYEAVNLASIQRYLSTYFTGLLVLACGLLLHHFSNKKYSIIIALCLAVNIVWLQPLMNLTFSAKAKITTTIDFRSPFRKINDFSKTIHPIGNKIYVVSQNDNNRNGYDYYISKYEFTPVPGDQPFGSWSLGKPFTDKDIWTRNYGLEEWQTLLWEGGYTYLYLHHIDKGFIDNYGVLFEDCEQMGDQTIFKIHWKSNGEMYFSKIY